MPSTGEEKRRLNKRQNRIRCARTEVQRAAKVLLAAHRELQSQPPILAHVVRAVAEGSGVAFGARGLGKIKMIIQSVAIPVILGLAVNVPATSAPWSGWLCLGLAWATVIVTVLSAVPYLRGITHLQADRSGVA